MSLFNHITDAEKRAMTEYIRAHAFDTEAGGERAHYAPLSEVLSTWIREKISLFHLLGDNLMVSKDITFERSAEELNRALDNLWEKGEFPKLIRNAMDIHSIDVYKEDHKAYRGESTHYIYALWDITKNEFLSTNIYNGVTYSTLLPNDKELKIEPGCRPMRIIQKIVKAIDSPEWSAAFEEYRLEHSRILNTKTLSGTLTLSIHPLDYMTMSDNNENWSSCMSWKGHGCYRAGTVEMMNSPCVIVAYLSHKSMDLTPDFSWNSKSWRSLFIITPDLISSVKGYPYHSTSLAQATMNWLNELSGDLYGDIQEAYEVDRTDDTFGRADLRAQETGQTVTFRTEHMYNDCGLASHTYIRFAHDAKEQEYDITYSGFQTCMICGRGQDSGDGALHCHNCTPSYWCGTCREYHFAEEMHGDRFDGLCEKCYRDNVFTDALTNEEFYNPKTNRTINRIWLIPEEFRMRALEMTWEEWDAMVRGYNCSYITVDMSNHGLDRQRSDIFINQYPMPVDLGVNDFNREVKAGRMTPSDRWLGYFPRERYYVTPSLLCEEGKRLFEKCGIIFTD